MIVHNGQCVERMKHPETGRFAMPTPSIVEPSTDHTTEAPITPSEGKKQRFTKNKELPGFEPVARGAERRAPPSAEQLPAGPAC
jgi:hypothetical protein